jgi:hypothetical protein
VANQTEKKIDQGTQAVIEEGKRIDQGTQTVIEERESREKQALVINGQLTSTLQEIGNIKSLPKAPIEELQQTALKNPPKELQ